jgi:hypothetical protein
LPAVFTSLGEVASGDRPAHAGVIRFSAVGCLRNDEIAETFVVEQLLEHHRKQLIPISMTFDRLVAIVCCADAVEFTSVEKQGTEFIHNGLILAAKINSK